jgi:transmembrane sensor
MSFMKQPVENLLAKYFAGEANLSEQEEVLRWKEKNEALFESYRKAYHARYFDSRSFTGKRLGMSVQRKRFDGKILLKIAAVFAGLLMISAAMYFYARTLNVRYVNITASVRHIVLPDGTEAYLDRNASLQYEKDFFGNFHRKVNMTGRVFFHVFRDERHPFLVNAGIVTVKVLGTQFTVNRMKVKTQVLLTHGKVLVKTRKINHDVLLQKSGDQVIVQNDGEEKENNVKASLYASWLNKKIYFNDCTVKEVCDMLYDSYNLQVDIHPADLLSKKLYGSAPSDDPRLIAQALAQILHVEVQVKRP